MFDSRSRSFILDWWIAWVIVEWFAHTDTLEIDPFRSLELEGRFLGLFGANILQDLRCGRYCSIE